MPKFGNLHSHAHEEPVSLTAKGIFKRFQQRYVCRNLNLTVKSGEIVGLLGPNGAGKTTFFNILVGLERGDRGQILLNDQDITRLSIHQRAQLGVGYLPQQPTIFRKMTVEDNLRAVLELLPIDRQEQENRLLSVFNRFQLNHLKKFKAQSLSGGERRRLEIARTSLLEIRVFFLDEPFAAIDPISVFKLQDLLREMRDQGYALVISDHNVREILNVVDRAYVINLGTILFHGKPKDLQEDPRVRALYLGEQFQNTTR